MVRDVSINEYLDAGNRWRDLHLVELGGRHCGLLKIHSGWLATKMWLPISASSSSDVPWAWKYALDRLIDNTWHWRAIGRGCVESIFDLRSN